MARGAGETLKDLLTGIAITALLVTSGLGTVAGQGGDGEAPDEGEYVQAGVVHDLTPLHVTHGDGNFTVDVPLASELRINPDYAEHHLGDWASDHAYASVGDRVLIEDTTAKLMTFAPGPDEVFAQGSNASLRFEDRPMWVSVTNTTDGLNVTAHDGNSTGQDIHLKQAWLEDYGLDTQPIAIHEDGGPIDVSGNSDGTGFTIAVDHFSVIQLQDPTLDTSWQVDDFTRFYSATHPGRSSEFNVTNANVDTQNITFRFWETSAGTDGSFHDETFARTTRESRNNTGNYTYNYINETNLQQGHTLLGHHRFNFTATTTTSYVFTKGNLSYHFDRDQGWLRMVEDPDNGSSIEIISTRLDLPPPPLLPCCVARLTEGNGLVVEAEWNDFGGGADTRIVVDWSSGDSDEEVRGNILSDHTHLTVEADFSAWAILETHPPPDDPADPTPCQDLEIGEGWCHTQSLIGDRHTLDVHFDDEEFQVEEDVVVNCDGVGCAWSEARNQWEWNENGTFTLTGGAEHGIGGETSFPFWYCAKARVWFDRPVTDPPTKEQISCTHGLVPEDPHDPRSGTITVDALDL